MDTQNIFRSETRLLAVTGLYLSEFEELHRVFGHRWKQFFKHFDMKRQRRNSPLTGTQIVKDTPQLNGSELKLFFILNHFKINSIQENEGMAYDLSQPDVSHWIKILTPILQQSIVDLHLQPARTSDELIRLFRNRQHKDSVLDKPATDTLNGDVTERPLSRNVDYEVQKADFSGKQKEHTIKNTVVSDELQFIHFLGPTWRGAIHDKAMIEIELPDFKNSVYAKQWFLKDTGYQGYIPEGVNSIQPYKKKAGEKLEDWQKEFNTWVSSLRIVIENAIGGMKRLRVLVDKTRGFSQEKFDKIVCVAAGLHNFRVTRRQTTYACAINRVRVNLQF